MVTMRDVAEQAQVSVATVSRVINKSGFVSPELEARVRGAMAELNYQPSALARGLRRQETQTVGLLVPQLDHPFFSGLAYAIEKACFEADYRTFVCSAEEDQAKEDAYIAMLMRQRVDGVILVPTGHTTEKVQALAQRGTPVVLVDRDLEELDISRVLSNNARGAYQGIRYLLELGHRRIGVVGGPSYSHPMKRRIHGLTRALADAHVEPDPELMLVVDEGQQFELGYHAALKLLRRASRPTAIFALTDVMAVGVLHAAAQLGVAVPEELSVMGFDDIPLAAYSIPGLTTVAQPIYRMGATAVEVLLQHIRDPQADTERIVLNTQLVFRKSTAPCP
ncbi:MAG TPA: LacI family transcriptional regulator [Chloroflexi bacterium]|nr:LacI family transcriptional regulator [Chloroflexota bacterium]